MNNFTQPGNTLTVTAPAAVTSGQLVVVGSIVGVASTTEAIGVPVELDGCLMKLGIATRNHRVGI